MLADGSKTVVGRLKSSGYEPLRIKSSVHQINKLGHRHFGNFGRTSKLIFDIKIILFFSLIFVLYNFISVLLLLPGGLKQGDVLHAIGHRMGGVVIVPVKLSSSDSTCQLLVSNSTLLNPKLDGVSFSV